MPVRLWVLLPLVVALSLLAGCGGGGGSQIAASEKPGWVLTFQDEFDGPTLDTTKWHSLWDDWWQGPVNYNIKNGVLHLIIDGQTSGRVVSGIETSLSPQNFAQQYGLFEIRARCPKGSGLHSGFVLCPKDNMG